jgi:beta-lactamase regulating signal transducer with metallopeptidase domain
MNAALWSIVHASWHAAVLAVLVLLVQFLLGRHLPARWRFALWFLVLVRLSLVPLPESRWSLYNWLPAPEQAARYLPVRAAATAPALAARDLERLAVAAAPSTPPAPTLWHLIAVLYLAGAGLVLFRFLLATFALRRIIRRAAPVTDPRLLAAIEEARRTIGIRRPLAASLSDQVASPAVVGIWRTRLLIPAGTSGTLQPHEIRFVLLHECAHIARNDIAINYWLVLLAALHWFNPIVWLLLPRIRADRELACDETVLRLTGESAAYGETLLKLMESSRLGRPLVGAVGVVDTKSFFKRRIRMIAAFRRTPAWLAVPALGLVIVFAGATLTSAVTAVAQTVQHAVAASAPAAATELESKLDKRLPEFKTDPQKMSLTAVLDSIRHEAGINIVMDAGALSAAQIDINPALETPVNLTNVTVRQALAAALLAVAQPNLTFVAHDDVLVITTRDASRTNVTRVYDVSDLLAIAAPPVQVRNVGPDGQPVVQSINESGTPQDLSHLVDAIQTAVQPDIWRERGGTKASATGYKNTLIVTGPADLQDEVLQLLKKLRTPEAK